MNRPINIVLIEKSLKYDYNTNIKNMLIIQADSIFVKKYFDLNDIEL